MNRRREALITGAKYYAGECGNNPAHRYRWTGSGACVDCHPRRRGTLQTAMTALYGPARISLEYAKAKGLPMFRAVCSSQGHSSWRYVKTPHICLQCAALARDKAPRKDKPIKRRPAPTALPWYFVADLRSGLVVSRVVHSNSVAINMRREIRRAHPGMILIVMSRKTRAAVEAMPMLRLDTHYDKPDWGE